ncbi:DUF1876 domain-containing protein [Paractinoplanes durhamensis]|uniref:DUF1876 domain-containing protein n=1 Tax=Paractinoplanes durhamensis TaxID=113563 RepID=A0ABQ3YRM7_9ACTN|nr:DUF1876 domain-containing protein [Actinoplanes durhamensis]GIE00175.1 hypothetical protein Adu01nite_15250 [Actinoplanes durhamensis]
MAHVRNWTVEVNITESEQDRRTHATAILRTDARVPLRGDGEAHRNPVDAEVPEIGDELATARALADLAYKLLDVTVGDIEQFTRRPARLDG